MDLLALIIAASVIVLLLFLLSAIHNALLKLNFKLWLSFNYPGTYRKAWPEEACNMVYTPKAVALGIHPLFLIMSGILAIGIFFISSSGAEGGNFLQSTGEVMIAVPVAVFMIYVSKLLYKILKQSLAQGTAQDDDTGLREPLETVESLKARITSGDAGRMLPFYRMWHAFFIHDMLIERMHHLMASTAPGRGIPPEAEGEIRTEIRNVGEAYESSLGSEKIPGKIRKEVKKRYRQLSKLSGYEIAGEEKIVFDCTACRRKLRVGAKYSGTEQSCPACGEEFTVPREDKTLFGLKE